MPTKSQLKYYNNVVKAQRATPEGKEKQRQINLRAYTKRTSDPETRLLNYAKNRAIKSNSPFNLEKGDLKAVSNCPICDVVIDYSRSVKVGLKNSPSIDKVIPSLGYVKGNTAVICLNCNRKKQDNTVEDLQKIINYINSFKEVPNDTDEC